MLKAKILTGVGLVFFLVSPTIVNAADRCTTFFQNNVRDKLKIKFDQSFLDEFHSAMCSEKEDRINKAKSRGIQLGYKDFVFDFAGTSKKIGSYQESMCSATSKITADDTFFEVVRNHVNFDATRMFVECIRITDGGLDFHVVEGTEGDSIRIDLSYSRRIAPGAELRVTNLVVTPEAFKDKIKCEGPLAKVSKKSPAKITQSTGVLSVTCRPGPNYPRKGDNDFSIVLNTNAGTIEGYVQPFYRGKSDRLAELEKKYKRLSKQVASHGMGLSDAINKINTSNSQFDSFRNDLAVKVIHYHIGEYDRGSQYGRHFYCYKDNEAPALLCGGMAAFTHRYKTEGGAKCGYNYYIVACMNK